MPFLRVTHPTFAVTSWVNKVPATGFGEAASDAALRFSGWVAATVARVILAVGDPADDVWGWGYSAAVAARR